MTQPEPPTTSPLVIVCYSKCWACQFGEHSGEPHTWMDGEDIEFSQDVAWPETPEAWAALTQTHPCGCWCLKEKPCETCKGSGSHPANEQYPCPACEGRMVAPTTAEESA